MRIPNLSALLVLGSLAPARPEPDAAVMTALANLVLLAAETSGRSPLEIDEHVQQLISSGYPLTALKVQRLHDAVASGELSVDQMLAVLGKLAGDPAQTTKRLISVDDAIGSITSGTPSDGRASLSQQIQEIEVERERLISNAAALLGWHEFEEFAFLRRMSTAELREFVDGAQAGGHVLDKVRREFEQVQLDRVNRAVADVMRSSAGKAPRAASLRTGAPEPRRPDTFATRARRISRW